MVDKKHIQKTLTPIILEEGMPGYETVQDIEEKLNDPEVFNIAITGPYGSGKSTVLKSLKVRSPNRTIPIWSLNINQLPLYKEETGNTLETRGLTYSYTFLTKPKNAHLGCKGIKIF